MNKARRKELRDALIEFRDKYSEVKDKLIERLECVRDDEQEAYNNLPESLQLAERGDAMLECIDAINDALFELDEGPFSFIEEICEACEIDLDN